jgi:hypothetical protein
MMDVRLRRETGTVGLVSGILLVVLNLSHPVGNTEMYADGVRFVAKMDTFWVILHLVIAVALLPVPLVVRAWASTLGPERARVWGDFSLTLIVMGTVIGSIHLAGIDGVALPAFGKVLRAPGGVPELNVAAAALLKVHLTAFVSWVVVFWMAGQAAVAFAAFSGPAAAAGPRGRGGSGRRIRSRVDAHNGALRPVDDAFGGGTVPTFYGRVHDLLLLDLLPPAEELKAFLRERLIDVARSEGPRYNERAFSAVGVRPRERERCETRSSSGPCARPWASATVGSRRSALTISPP